MEKVLVGIHVPSVKSNCDAFVPLDVPVSELTEIIADGFRELTNGKYEVSGLEMLSLKEPALLLDPKHTLREYGVKDGMQLYLI
jgi:hypothetical protein